jgi:hypothetical protein
VESSILTPEDTEDTIAVEQPEEIKQTTGPKEAHLISEASAGYRFYNLDGDAGNAAEYEYLHSKPEVSALINYLGLDNKFVLEGNFLNEKDYTGDLTFDHKGIYRFQLRTESLFHNLEHELLGPDFIIGTPPDERSYTSSDNRIGTNYGVRVEQDTARFRYKFPLYPVHINLEYWRMFKEGTMQQRFADHAFEGPPGSTSYTNTLYSRSRGVDLATHEGNLVFDTHLGFMDIIYDFKIRQLNVGKSAPVDFFIARSNTTEGYIQHGAGFLPHDEIPESRYYAHSLKLHTSLSGGVVGVASYTYGKRENLSDMNVIKGADQASDTIHSVAGDLTYTPCGFFSMALKYRHQEIDRDAPDSLTTADPLYSLNPVFAVRQAIDTEKDIVTATLSFLPIRELTVKAEYSGEFVSRDNLQGWNQPGTIATVRLPGSVDTHKGTITLLSRPYKGLRVKAQYSYSSADHALYANSYEQRHLGTLLLTYSAPGKWGVTANTRIVRESSDHLTISSLDISAPSETIRLPRERKLSNATFSLWYAPLRNLTLSGSFGLLRNKTDQGVLYAGTNSGSYHPTDYTSQAQVYSLSAVYTPAEWLDLSLLLQQVRSFSHFTPGIADSGTSDYIQGISEGNTRENSLSARGEFRISKNISCMVDYSYRDYDDKAEGQFSGTVHTISANLKAKW